MKPSTLEVILDEALTHGNHAPDCTFVKKQKRFLPARHPAKPAPPNISECDCWKKKANRMVRALRAVERTEIPRDADDLD